MMYACFLIVIKVLKKGNIYFLSKFLEELFKISTFF